MLFHEAFYSSAQSVLLRFRSYRDHSYYSPFADQLPNRQIRSPIQKPRKLAHFLFSFLGFLPIGASSLPGREDLCTDCWFGFRMNFLWWGFSVVWRRVNAQLKAFWRHCSTVLRYGSSAEEFKCFSSLKLRLLLSCSSSRWSSSLRTASFAFLYSIYFYQRPAPCLRRTTVVFCEKLCWRESSSRCNHSPLVTDLSAIVDFVARKGT